MVSRDGVLLAVIWMVFTLLFAMDYSVASSYTITGCPKDSYKP